MKKHLGAVVVIAGMITVMVGCKRYYPIDKMEYDISTADISEGKRMTMLICGPCHYNPIAKNLSGKKLKDFPRFFGQIYASNITQHPDHGIGKYTNGELAYLIRSGIARNGKLMPYMKRPNLADEDLKSIIAYLRSDDCVVKPSDIVPGKTRYTPIGKLGICISKSSNYLKRNIYKPRRGTIAMGKYLVDNLACYHCHSKNFISLDLHAPEKSKGYMGGGSRLKDGSGKTVETPNLTPHGSAMGSWSEEEFRRAITEGIGKTNEVIAYPMPLYPQLREDEISAMYNYLQSLPSLE